MFSLGPTLAVAGALGRSNILPLNSAEVQQYFDRIISIPNQARQQLYADLIDGLVADGIWSLLDVLCVVDTDAATSLTNLKQNTFNGYYPPDATAVIFTADRGFSPNGTVHYVSSGFNPSTAGGNYTQNSAFIAAWNLGTVTSGAALIRSVPNVNIEIWPTDGANVSWMVNNSGSTELHVTNPGDASGFYVASRTGSGAQAVYRNGTQLTTSTQASAAPENNELQIGYGAPSTWTIACWAFGGGLDGTQATALYNRVHTYLTGIGAV